MKTNKTLHKKWIRLIPYVLLMTSSLVFAEGRSLDQAAGSAVTTATHFARTISVFGFLVSAACFNLPGMAGYARKMLGGSILGSICAFGGPAIIRAIQSFF